MSEIVDELRRMCAVEKDQYEIAGTAYWTDAQLQAVLDKHVTQRFLQAEVRRIWTRNEANQRVVLHGEVEIAGSLDTETAEVVDTSGAAVEGVTFHADGRLEFAADQSSRPLLLSGTAYDLNAAAAAVLTDWAAAVKGGYDISVDGQKLSRSQRHSQLLEQARAFARKAVAGSVRMRRSDLRRRAR